MTSPTIYFAAALFSGRELLFNAVLAGALEQLKHRVLLPQRDGFEFSNLQQHVERLLPTAQVPQAVQSIIYLLDVGRLLPMADAVVANLDEPLDEGTVVEISYGRLLAKHVVGFRTDSRTPFGSATDALGGAHFFPMFQCHDLIRHQIGGRSEHQALRSVRRLARRIHAALGTGELMGRQIEKPAASTAAVEPIVEAANLLFSGVEDFKSDRGLRCVVQRFKEHSSRIRRLFPLVSHSPIVSQPRHAPRRR